MDEAGNENYDFGTDVLVDILRRLPPSSQRRVRLVCRRWRGAVDDRTSEMQSRAVRTLITVENTNMGTTTVSGYVLDDLPEWGFRKMWTGHGNVIGTCNGLIGLCDDGMPGGAVTMVNPVTREVLAVPPLPRYSSSGQVSRERMPWVRWHESYSFGYHPLTGRYKIVHVPCYLDRARTRLIAGWHDVVHVFTLGEASWREVPLPTDVRLIGSLGRGGVVSVDGTTYWLANREGVDEGKVVSFDLADERLYASPLPATAKPGVTLTVVRGRLGVAVDRYGKRTVWLLDGSRWRRRYEVQLDGRQRLTSPHFAHGKDYVLTMAGWGWDYVLYGHTLGAGRTLRLCDVLLSKEPAVCSVEGYIDRAFAYVETTEPLSVYQPRRESAFYNAYPRRDAAVLKFEVLGH